MFVIIFCMAEVDLKLSIIIPIYNSEKFLDKCIRSVLSQTLKDFELILVNDGSTDSSLDICYKYQAEDLRVKVFNQSNAGQSKARNVGLSIASGKYIAFVDSDDWVDKNYFEKLVSACEKYDADVSCASILRVKKHIKKFRIKYTEEKTYEIPQEKIDVARVPNMCYVWNKVYKRSFLEKLNLRFVEGMFFEDVDFVAKAVYYSNKIVTVPGTYYFYWSNSASTVKTMLSSDKKRGDSIRSKKNILEFFREHNLTTRSRYLIRKKNCIKCLGITFIKIYEWDTRKVYYLFGAIPIFEKISYA